MYYGVLVMMAASGQAGKATVSKTVLWVRFEPGIDAALGPYPVYSFTGYAKLPALKRHDSCSDLACAAFTLCSK